MIVGAEQHGRRLLSPFDHCHGALLEHLRQTEGHDLRQRVETVDVGVNQLDAERGGVAPDQGERRAGHWLTDAHGPGQALREGGLARSEIAVEKKHVAREQGPGDPRGHGRSGSGPRTQDPEAHPGPAANLAASASRATRARTKSARILATTSPPPRRAAAGW